jgi:hypothetical protein
MVEDFLQGHFHQNQQISCRRTNPVAAKFDLMSGFLSGNIENFPAANGNIFHNLKHQRGFADTRFAADQNSGTVYDSAAEHPVNLRNAGEHPLALISRNLFDGQRLAVKRHAGTSPRIRLGNQLLGKTVPTAAGGAFAQPLG